MSEPVSSIYPHKLRRLYWPFLALAEVCREVVGTVAGTFSFSGLRYTVPRFTFLGPVTNDPQKRVGFFALVQGHESAGATALLRLLEAVVNCPALAAGCDLVLYPVCNPTGFEDETRHNRAGRDLAQEFWRKSDQPEVQILEKELRVEPFDGIVTLHTDETSDRLFVWNAAGEMGAHPLAERLRPPPDIPSPPFETVIRTPGRVTPELQAQAALVALQAVLTECRGSNAQERKI
jgi:murein peptide amidase A